MGTISTYKRKNGAISYTARVRITRDGTVIHQEVETFERKADAALWMKKRESQLSLPGAIEAIKNPEPTLGELITKYLDSLIAKSGRTKEYTLKAIARSEFGKLPVSQITSQSITAFAETRLAGKAGPVTVGNDFALLGSLFEIAKPAWGYALDRQALIDAKAVCKRLGYIKRANQRDRRPTLEELDRLLAYFHDAARRRTWVLPMLKVLPFAIFSTRREAEIVRIRWDKLDHERKRAWISDVKHPRKKLGNHKWAQLTPQAWDILMSMPRVSDRVFPFTTSAICAQFERACDWLEIDDLRFHDLRHEGVSWLFEQDWPIPRVAEVSLHEDWNMLRRYTHMNGSGDKYAGWKWLPVVIAHQQGEKKPRAKRGKKALQVEISDRRP